ncbi:MAG: hypothetical protein ACOC1O_00915 [bacterium]
MKFSEIKKRLKTDHSVEEIKKAMNKITPKEFKKAMNKDNEKENIIIELIKSKLS